MRIDPKYFNRFIGICALITVFVILYSTIRYSQKQVDEFNEKITSVEFKQLTFKAYSQPDSLSISALADGPVIIQFWSTWSNKSQEVNRFLHNYQQGNRQFTVIAAAVRDDESLIRDYIQSHSYSFIYIDGTEFYQNILVPGMPAQIFLSEGSQFFTAHIGDDISSIKKNLDKLLKNP